MNFGMRRPALGDITNRERRHSVPATGVPKKPVFGSHAAAGDLEAFVDAPFRKDDAVSKSAMSRRRSVTTTEAPQQENLQQKPLFVITSDSDWEHKLEEEITKRYAQLFVDLKEAQNALEREQHVQVENCLVR